MSSLFTTTKACFTMAERCCCHSNDDAGVGPTTTLWSTLRRSCHRSYDDVVVFPTITSLPPTMMLLLLTTTTPSITMQLLHESWSLHRFPFYTADSMHKQMLQVAGNRRACITTGLLRAPTCFTFLHPFCPVPHPGGQRQDSGNSWDAIQTGQHGLTLLAATWPVYMQHSSS